MFDQGFYDLINSHLETELKTQNTYLYYELIDIERSAKATGALDSAEYYKDLSRHLRDHAIRSLHRLFQVLLKTVSARAWDLDREMTEELMQIIFFYGEKQKEHLGRFLPEASEWRDRIDLTIDDLLRRYNQDIEFMLIEEEHEKNAERGTGMSEPPIKIIGPVGVIQTGGGNFSISTQKNIQPITKDLNDVLKFVEDKVAQARSDLSPSDVANVVEAVAKCRSELAQPQPDPVKIGSIFAGIAQTIQTTAALQPAYEAIKWCLSLLQ